MCGVGAYVGSFDVAFQAVADVLFALQHRGQDSCGIAYISEGEIKLVKGMGLVRDVLSLTDVRSEIAIGHVRYPTAGKPDLNNAQPHVFTWEGKPVLALASNGDVVNYWELREEMESAGLSFVSENDGELMVKFLGWTVFGEGKPMKEGLLEIMRKFKGAFSGVVLDRSGDVWVFRDPHGFRPLYVARTENGDMVVASETCGFGIVGGENWEEVSPGVVLRVSREGWEEMFRVEGEPGHCVFELIYFSRPDSTVFGVDVYEFRKRIGKVLAEREENEVDVVVPVPDSSNAVALGYAQALGVPFEFGLIRNHYVGRTFIRPHQVFRDESVKRKFNPVRSVIENKAVVLVDDSIVRGTTLRKLVRMLKRNGAREVHVRIGSPPVIGSCFFGIDTPTHEELIASNLSVEQIRKHLTADSLVYLTLNELRNLLPHDGFCCGCFSQEYPLDPRKYRRGRV